MNGWGWVKRTDATWSVKKKRKECKRNILVIVRRLWDESGDPICVVSTSCWRREAAARGCRNRDPYGSWHVRHVGGLGQMSRRGEIVSFSIKEKKGTNGLT